MFWASIEFFVVLDAAVQTQHITYHLVKVPVILMLQSSLLLWGYFYLFRQNGSQHLWKCLLKGMKEPSVSPWTTGSWQVLASASWISPIGLINVHRIAFNSSAVFSIFNAIEIIAFLRAQFPSACISSPMGFRISHVAFKEPSFFDNEVLESPNKTAVLCMSKRSLIEIGQRSSCGQQILGHPAADSRVKGCTAIQRGHVDFKKTGNFRKLIK